MEGCPKGGVVHISVSPNQLKKTTPVCDHPSKGGELASVTGVSVYAEPPRLKAPLQRRGIGSAG